MNTIPSIFNERQINYSVIGGSEKPSKILMPVTCVVLSRGGRAYRSRVLENVSKCGFERVLIIEDSNKSLAGDNDTLLYPSIKFIVPLERANTGELINTAIELAESQWVLVLQDDMCASPLSFPPPLAKKMIENNRFCICPKLTTSSLQVLPIRYVPSAEKSVFSVEAGFYNKEKFIQLGGFDYTISSPYWQKLDLFFRAWLWGESVSIDTSLSFAYAEEIPEENKTMDLAYLRFYLKNLLPTFKTDHAEIPMQSFIVVVLKMKKFSNLSEAVKSFFEARRWTKENTYRFKKDAAYLIEHWGEEKKDD